MIKNSVQKNIPEGWKKVNLSDCFINHGGTSLEEYAKVSSGKKFISIGNYSTNGNYIDNGQRIEFNEKTSQKLLNKDDLVMVLNDKTLSGSLIGSTILIPEDNSYIYNQRSERLVSKNNIDSKYAWFLLNSNLRKKVFSISQGGTQIYVNFPSVKKIDFLLPILIEQKRIVKILETWDGAIETLAQKIEIKENVKRGLMQRLLTGETRLPGFSGEWRLVKLEELCEIKTGKKDNQDKVANGKYPFFVRSPVIEKINTYSYDGEAILIPGEGNIGKIFHYINGKFDYHQRVYKISDFKNNTFGKFIHYVLLKDFSKQTKRHSVKATVDSLRLPTFKLFEFSVPSFKEQKAIARVLTTADNEVEQLTKKLAFLKDQKKYLLNNLITGKIRTPKTLSTTK